MTRARKLCVAIVFFAALMAACSGQPENAANSNAESSSPVAQSGTAPMSSETSPPAAKVQPVEIAATVDDPVAPPKVTGIGQPARLAPSGPAPKLIVSKMKMDFGKQPQSRTIARTITVRNGGKAPLKIDAVEPS